MPDGTAFPQNINLKKGTTVTTRKDNRSVGIITHFIILCNYDIILMSEILFIVGGIRLFYFVREMSSPDLYASANSTKATAFILSIVLSEYPNFSPI